MPKNSNNQSPLDKLAAEMETQAQAETQAASKPETTQEAAQEQTGTVQAQMSRYVPADNEKHLYHLQLEKQLFDKTTGKRLSTPYVQKFSERAYNKFMGKKNDNEKSNAEMLGYTVTVLWNPKENI